MDYNGSDIIEINRVTLEGINKESNYKKFINGYDTPFNTFGEIVVAKDKDGVYKEIITDREIPLIETNYDSNWEIYPVDEYPRSPYRGKRVRFGYITESEIHYYINNNNNEKYIASLNEFIDNSIAISNEKKESFIKKLIKKQNI